MSNMYDQSSFRNNAWTVEILLRSRRCRQIPIAVDGSILAMIILPNSIVHTPKVMLVQDVCDPILEGHTPSCRGGSNRLPFA